MNKLKNAIVIALTVAFTGLLVYDMDGSSDYDGPVVSNTGRKHRRGAFGGRVYKLFEFAPPDGAGMTDVCPLPNWLKQSEDFSIGPWAKIETGGTVTVTHNYAAGPPGFQYADRLQTGSCTGNSSAIYQNSIAGLSVPATGNVWVKGNGTSGIVIVGLGAGSYTGYRCNFTSTEWTNCSVTDTRLGGSVGEFLIGCINVTQVTNYMDTGPLDILIAGGMVTNGTTVAPYVKTTTVAAASQPTGAKGEVLSFGRPSSAYCNKNPAGGAATTGIANGDLVLYPNNMARVEYSLTGIKELVTESTRVNALSNPEDIANVSWTKAAGATVTANYATAPNGTLTADRLVYDATSSYVLGAYTTGGITVNTSVFLKGTSTSGAIDMCRGGGAGQCIVCNYVADSWSRCTWSHNFAIASNFFIGCDIPTKGGACSPAGDVLVWGLQGETGPDATSYIGWGTRQVEYADFVTSISPTYLTGLSTSATINTLSTHTWTNGGGTLGPILSGGGVGAVISTPYWWTYANIGPSSAQDTLGTISSGLVSYFPGFAAINTTTNHFSSSHSGTAFTLCQNGTCSTSGASTLGTPTYLRIILGNATTAAANLNNKRISEVCVDLSLNGCK